MEADEINHSESKMIDVKEMNSIPE